jgi:tRNA(Ile)-lysidine synthase TilS/MesJ
MNSLLNQDQEHTVHTPDLQLVPVFLALMENITLDAM